MVRHGAAKAPGGGEIQRGARPLFSPSCPILMQHERGCLRNEGVERLDECVRVVHARGVCWWFWIELSRAAEKLTRRRGWYQYGYDGWAC